MSGMGCIMLAGLPRTVRRPALKKHFVNPEVGGGPIEYILHPLGNDLTRAVIKFTDDKRKITSFFVTKTFLLAHV